MGGCTYHTSAPLLRRSYGITRFEYKSRGNELDFVGRFIFRAQGFRPQQPRCGGILSPLLEHERTFFDRFSTLLRGRWRHYIVCRSICGIFATLDRSRSFPATKPVARPATSDARRL